MKIDGSQYRSRNVIAEYIRHYMRYYGVTEYVEPFCGFGNIYAALYSNKKQIDPECRYYLSDMNPFTIAILDRLWKGEDIPDTLDKEKRMVVVNELKNRFRKQEDIFAPYEGRENWEVGCDLILGSLHQNAVKGYIGDALYASNVNDIKKSILRAPYPNRLICCDYADPELFYRINPKQKLIYCDFPEPSGKNMFPFGMFFDRNEFFKYAVSEWGEKENIIIFSSKYYPDNGRYEIVHEVGEQKLYVEKRWYVEDILNAAKGNKKKWIRRARGISEASARRKRETFS